MFEHELREVRIHLRRVAEPFVDLREAAGGRDVLRRGPKDGFELLACGIELAGFDQCAAERDPRRQIRRMALKTVEAGLDRFVAASEAPVFLRECRKRNLRRIRLDPAP